VRGRGVASKGTEFLIGSAWDSAGWEDIVKQQKAAMSNEAAGKGPAGRMEGRKRSMIEIPKRCSSAGDADGARSPRIPNRIRRRGGRVHV
jgi:hypothetical protein